VLVPCRGWVLSTQPWPWSFQEAFKNREVENSAAVLSSESAAFESPHLSDVNLLEYLPSSRFIEIIKRYR